MENGKIRKLIKKDIPICIEICKENFDILGYHWIDYVEQRFIESLNDTAYTTEVNVFELTTGAYLFKGDTSKNLEKVIALISRLRVLQLDRKAALKGGQILGELIKEGKKIEETDCLIAGIAITNGINKIVTANISHYERIKEIEVIDY